MSVAPLPDPVLSVTINGDNTASLSWTGVDTATYGLAQIHLYRKVAGANWASDPGANRIAILRNGETSFTDTTRVAGTTYVYRVRLTFGMAFESTRIVALGTDPVLGDYIDVVRRDYKSDDINSPQAHWAGDPISADKLSSWERPMGAVDGTLNGIGVPDIGVANGFKDFSADWRSPSGGTPVYYDFRGAYWGHLDYKALYGPQWPVAPFTGNRTYYDTWNGDEFWIQFRLKIDGGRWIGAPNQAQKGGKLFYLQCISQSSACQIYLHHTPHRANGELRLEHDGQSAISSVSITLDDSTTGLPFALVPDEWWTFMIHVKAGHVNTRDFENPDGVLEIFAASMTDTAWRTLYSNQSFAFRYSFPPAISSNVRDPPAWNMFSPRNFPNHYMSSSGNGPVPNTFAYHYTQLILSSAPIPLPAVIAP